MGESEQANKGQITTLYGLVQSPVFGLMGVSDVISKVNLDSLDQLALLGIYKDFSIYDPSMICGKVNRSVVY